MVKTQDVVLFAGLGLVGVGLAFWLMEKVGGVPAGHAVLSGKISDVDTGDGIAGALISLDGNTATTSMDGLYAITVPFGEYHIVVEALNYGSYTDVISLTEQKVYGKDVTLKRTGPPTTQPVGIEFPGLPTSLTQYWHPYVVDWWAPYPIVHQMHMEDCKPYTNVNLDKEGYVYRKVTGRVYDAAGNGVPNVTLLVWHSDVPDAYRGILNFFGTSRTSTNPLQLITDANGEFQVIVGYRTDKNWLIENKCQSCWLTCYPSYICHTITSPVYFTCSDYDTPFTPYTITAQVKDTALKSPPGVISAKTSFIG